MRPAELHAHADTVFQKKLDAARFQGGLYRVKRALTWPNGLVLDHVQRHGREAGPVCERCLGPFQQAARRADLGGADHGDTLYLKLE